MAIPALTSGCSCAVPHPIRVSAPWAGAASWEGPAAEDTGDTGPGQGECARWCLSCPGPQAVFGVTVSSGALLLSWPCQQLNSALQGSDTNPTCTPKGGAPMCDPGMAN